MWLVLDAFQRSGDTGIVWLNIGATFVFATAHLCLRWRLKVHGVVRKFISHQVGPDRAELQPK